jgi:hypothetical protein
VTLRARHRILAATGGAAAVAVVAAVIVVAFAVPHGAGSGASPGSSSASAASAGGPRATAGGSSGAGGGSSLADGCTGALLKAQLAGAVRGGASVIVAVGRLTGKSAAGDPASAGAPAFYGMTLKSVRTLRGPAVASGSTAWIPGPAPGTPANPVNSALLTPGGSLFAIVWPKAATHYLVGPTLQLAPVAGADVVFTPYVCWNLTGLQPDLFHASTPLLTVPGGANFGGEHQAAENGLYTLPLATVERIAASA